MFTPINFPHALNFISISRFLQNCCQANNIGGIEKLHAHLYRIGLLVLSPNLQTKLILAYTTTTCRDKSNLKTLNNFLKCLNPQNPLPFNSIISHFSHNGLDPFALRTLCFMHSSGVYTDSYALCCSLNSASRLKDACFGNSLHAYVKKSGWFASVFVGSALVDFYVKLLSVDNAAIVFDEIPIKNTVCMNALLSGYAEAKMWDEGLDAIRRMPVLRLDVDSFTLSAALRACVGLCDVELGKQIHAKVIRDTVRLGNDVFIQSLLIEMYGKCGLMNRARKVFDAVEYRTGESQRDVVLWTSMLGVYGRAGDCEEVIVLFKEMLVEGIKPDEVAFLTAISACGHTGRVDLGMAYFDSMSRNYGLVPKQEHYNCIVNLLCRAGELDKAFKFINEIPDVENKDCAVSTWGALLSACNESGNINLGKLAARRALELEPDNAGVYVLLSNMYAKNGMWDEIENLRVLMKQRGVKKSIGWSWTDLKRAENCVI